MEKLRQATVEPVIGTLVNFLGMKRVNTTGITLANKCMLMAATCYNLKKLLNIKAPQAIAKVKTMQKKSKNYCSNPLVYAVYHYSSLQKFTTYLLARLKKKKHHKVSDASIFQLVL